MTLWTGTHQVPLSMEFSRQDYWSGLQFSNPRGHPGPGIEPTSPVSPVLQVDLLQLSHLGRAYCTSVNMSLNSCIIVS